MTATFSAIILNYNHSRHVARSIDAAIGQTVPFDEIIVVDDASTDDSVAVIQERLQNAPQARLVQNPRNLGVVPSGNAVLTQARGDYIFYMSADDDYSPHIVEWCREALAQYPDAAMISGNTRIHSDVTGKDRVFRLPFPQIIGCYTRADIEAIAQKRAFTFNIGANVMRRDAILAAGQQLPELRWHSDWFLYLLLASRAPFAVVPYEFVRVRQDAGQYSHACFHWKTQRPVIEAILLALKNRYPEAEAFFRTCALLPTYNIEALFLSLRNPDMRRYLTPLLCWRLIMYKPLRLAGRLCPEALRAAARRLARV